MGQAQQGGPRTGKTSKVKRPPGGCGQQGQSEPGRVKVASTDLEGLAQGVKPKCGEEGFLPRVSLLSEPM